MAAAVAERATVEEHFVWMITRQIKPGTSTDFEQAWRQDTMRKALPLTCQ